jgi:DNA polymerase III epsilon subunit-like protein
MQHWNGDICVVLDVETTGLNPDVHEIWQIAAIPLDSNFDVHPNYIPLNLFMRPSHFDRLDPEALKVTAANKEKLMSYGVTQDKGVDLFIEWIENLNIPLSRRGGRNCRIIPMGYNYLQFDLPFIKRWMGAELYTEYFSHRVLDPYVVAEYINDMAAFAAEPVPYSKLSLGWVAKQHKIDTSMGKLHDAMTDASITAKIYQAQCTCMEYIGWNK